SLAERLKYLGPGMILSASIVGSGELISTTYLGAQAGFILFWVVFFSCLVKIAVQLEFGKYTIYSGKTTMAAFNDLPGPRLGKANWTIWTWLIIMLLKMLQVGGIVGGVALILAPLTGAATLPIWTYAIAIAVSLLIFRGYYAPIERWCIILIGLFTVFTIISLISLQWTPYAISAADLKSGLSFDIPNKEMLFFAIAVFGITGVGGDEIMAYNYWLIEKGYAANTGPRENSPAWEKRAKGWIHIMYIDAILALVVYTTVTAIFYLLGAAVLNAQELLPEKSQLIEVLSTMYTTALGGWAKGVFMVGAFVVLFSTLLAALAAWSRLFSDAFGQIGMFDFKDLKQRRKAIAICAWVIPLIWATCFIVLKAPTLMVLIGGVATTAILIIVVFATAVMRWKWLPPFLRSGFFYDAALVLSIIAIAAVGFLGLWNTYKSLTKEKAKPAAALSAPGSPAA
ncbi:MAG: Nramp family divalent metal transporter, partial [Verrucomicrobiota bacterium]